MTESGTTSGRARRRARRQSGPPVDDRHGTERRAAGQVEQGAAPPQTQPDADGAPRADDTAAAEADIFTAEIAKSLWVPMDALDDVIELPMSPKTGAGKVVLVRPADKDSTGATPVAAPSAGSTPADRESVDEMSPAEKPSREAAVVRKAARRTRAAKARLGWPGWAAAAVVVLSLAGLLGSGGFYVYHQRHADAVSARREAYVQTARQAVLNLTNIKDNSAGPDIDRVLSVASGDLKQEFAQNRDAYQKVVQQIKIKATGEVIESAIESEDAHAARVLVVAKQTLTNAGTDQPQERNYRFRVTLARDDNGAVTASGVEFVA